MASVRFLAALLCLWTVACTGVYGIGTTGNYYVLDNANKPCLLLNVSATFSQVNVSMGAPPLVNGSIFNTEPVVDGSCGHDRAVATISQDYNDTSGQLASSSITFAFEANFTTNVWSVSSITVGLKKMVAASSEWEDTEEAFANDTVVVLVAASSPNLYSGASVNGSYQCNAQTSWTLLAGGLANGQLDIANFSAKAFHVHGSNFTSGPVTMCDGDKTPSTSNVVPIAVGAALCGLVLIVLVAYVIGRSRHQRTHRGYQSV